MKHLDIEIQSETITLLADRAAFWARERTLFLADLHLGKAAAFRSAGIPIPHGTTSEDLERISELLHGLNVRRLVILGDFFHARDGKPQKTLEEVQAWRRKQESLEIVLVRGNHDIRAGDPPREWDFQMFDEPFQIGPFSCVHHSKDSSLDFVFQGHIHPKIRLVEPNGASKYFPCFVREERRLIFPAFGSFTGGMNVKFGRKNNGEALCQYYLLAEGEVLPYRGR